MFKFDSTLAETPLVLREVMPVERSLNTGGALVDAAIALWFRWHDDQGGLPDWSCFHPFEHPQLLTNVSVTKRVGKDYLCVLVGEAVRNWLPPKIQGQYIHIAIPAENAADVIRRSDRALEDGLPNYVEKTMSWNPGHEFVRYRALYLPFICARDDAARILTVFDFETSIE